MRTERHFLLVREQSHKNMKLYGLKRKSKIFKVKYNLIVFGIKIVIRKNVKYVTELTVEAVEESPVEIYTSQQDDINRWGGGVLHSFFYCNYHLSNI